MEAHAMVPSLLSAAEREEQRLKRIRQQMREQDERRHRDPEADPAMDTVHVLYVWRRAKWMLVAFVHDKPTPKRLHRWRRRYKVQDSELLRCLSLRTAHRYGAGDAPTGLLRRRVRPTPAPQPDRTAMDRTGPRRRTVRKPRHPHCDHKRGSKRCGKLARWRVAYNSGTKRIKLNRCNGHAWNPAHLPEKAKHIVRVEV